MRLSPDQHVVLKALRMAEYNAPVLEGDRPRIELHFDQTKFPVNMGSGMQLRQKLDAALKDMLAEAGLPGTIEQRSENPNRGPQAAQTDSRTESRTRKKIDGAAPLAMQHNVIITVEDGAKAAELVTELNAQISRPGKPR